MRYFETRFLEEADEFIASLDRKSAQKIFYNIDLAEQTNDPKTFQKNYMGKSGSSEAGIWVIKTGFSHFGIKQNQRKPWFSQLMGL